MQTTLGGVARMAHHLRSESIRMRWSVISMRKNHAHGTEATTRRQKQRPQPQTRLAEEIARDSIDDIGGGPFAFTIGEFCQAHRISPSTYFQLKREGQGPVEMAIGRRRLVSRESARKWRRAREVTT
jgi:hypothetical protein